MPIKAVAKWMEAEGYKEARGYAADELDTDQDELWEARWKEWFDAGKPPAPMTIQELAFIAGRNQIPQAQARDYGYTTLYRQIKETVFVPDADGQNSDEGKHPDYWRRKFEQASKPAWGLNSLDVELMAGRNTDGVEQFSPLDPRTALWWANFYVEAEKYRVCDAADYLAAQMGGPRRAGVYVPARYRRTINPVETAIRQALGNQAQQPTAVDF